jgi:hypothetical protein
MLVIANRQGAMAGLKYVFLNMRQRLGKIGTVSLHLWQLFTSAIANIASVHKFSLHHCIA